MRCAARACAARANARPPPSRLNPPTSSSCLLTTACTPPGPAAHLSLTHRDGAPVECSHVFTAAASPGDRPVYTPCSNSSLGGPRKSFRNLLGNMPRSTGSVAEVEIVHSRAVKAGLAVNVLVATRLANMYCKGGWFESAHKLFDEMPERNTVTWTVLITGLSGAGFYSKALGLFARMWSEGVFPNRITLVGVFKCYASVRDLIGGKGIHGWLMRNEVKADIILENSIVDFYAKCGELDYAKKVFDLMPDRDNVSWNVMIGAYFWIGDVQGAIELFGKSPFRDVVSWNMVINGQMRNGFYRMALEFLYQMVEAGPEFSHVTFSMALALVGALCLPELGRQIHCKLLRSKADVDGFILNSLIDMYCKCGSMESASTVFNKVPCNSKKVQTSVVCNDGNTIETISWSSMVAGYVHNGRLEEALSLFRRMFREHAIVDLFTLTSITSACSYAGFLAQGRQIHACIEKLGYWSDAYLSSAVVDMYGKCGSLEDAQFVFEKAENRNVVLWSSIIVAYASHGQGREAIRTFEMMLDNKVRPNEISFVGVLSACSHAGLVREGYKYFRSMKEDFGLVPSVEHFTCMVDLLGRAGLIQEARNFIFENDIAKMCSAWKALLSACRFHKNVDMAKFASELLVQLEPCDSGSFILLSNIYSTTSLWADASRFRSMMEEKGVRKQPGMSWIQLENKVHTFVAGDRSHPQMDHIYSYLSRVIPRLKEIGYQSEMNMVLHDVEVEEREVFLSYHSEKLAIACGIINTPCGSPIRVMKNLRVCDDCHAAIKYISQATGREIVLRDAHRFHHFKNGNCSCGDYW